METHLSPTDYIVGAIERVANDMKSVVKNGEQMTVRVNVDTESKSLYLSLNNSGVEKDSKFVHGMNCGVGEFMASAICLEEIGKFFDEIIKKEGAGTIKICQAPNLFGKRRFSLTLYLDKSGRQE